MNQTKNLKQWKNLDKDERAGFDFKSFAYEVQYPGDHMDFTIYDDADFDADANLVYRLKIEPDKYYYTMYKPDSGGFIEKVLSGSVLIDEHELNWHPIDQYYQIRPATADEIPKPKRVFKDGAFYPVVLKVEIGEDIAEFKDGEFDTLRHLNPRQINGNFKEDRFSWIGEELKIEWGKS